MRVLVLEDDRDTRQSLISSLSGAGLAVDEADSANAAHGLAQVYPYDGLIVDIGLPEGDDAGLRLIRSLRDEGCAAPVLFISARSTLEDRLAGFAGGGDDYLVKPFHLSEAVARLQAVLRRAHQGPNARRVLERGALRVDWIDRKITVNGLPVHLTAKEYGILELLASHPGRLFSREEIIERVWNLDFSAGTNIVDVYVWNLRKKLGGTVVETVRGLGYRFPLN